MLVLTRFRGETIRIGNGTDEIVITAVRCHEGKCRIGIEAPDGYRILRGELIENGEPMSPMEPNSQASERGRREAGCLWHGCPRKGVFLK